MEKKKKKETLSFPFENFFSSTVVQFFDSGSEDDLYEGFFKSLYPENRGSAVDRYCFSIAESE